MFSCIHMSKSLIFGHSQAAVGFGTKISNVRGLTLGVERKTIWQTQGR